VRGRCGGYLIYFLVQRSVMMDNMEKLEEEYRKETGLYAAMYHRNWNGAIKHYYIDKFCVWLADKLEELREEVRVDKIKDLRGSWEGEDYEMTYKDGEVNINNCVVSGEYSSLASFEAAELDEYPMLVFRKSLASEITGYRALAEKVEQAARDADGSYGERKRREGHEKNSPWVCEGDEDELKQLLFSGENTWPKRFCIEGPTDQELRDWGSKPKHDANGCRYVELDGWEHKRMLSKDWKIKEYMPRP
jgi:hypothetical protein